MKRVRELYYVVSILSTPFIYILLAFTSTRLFDFGSYVVLLFVL
jgi:hypothetical protein